MNALKPMMFYNKYLGTTKNSFAGKFFSASPVAGTTVWKGWPARLVRA